MDARIITLSVEVAGQVKTYDGLTISARGTKTSNSVANDCTVTISNLDRATRDYLITETSPHNDKRIAKKMTLEVGRQSFGTSIIFSGDITDAAITQPPDIKLTLRSQTKASKKGRIVSRSMPDTANLSTIAKQAAQDLGLSLQLDAPDKRIANYSFTGGALNQVDKLGQSGGVDAYVDDDALIVKAKGAPRKGKVRVLDMSSGMIGVPELTDRGVKVKMLIDQHTAVGGLLRVSSVQVPAANGDYVIYKLGFDVASDDTPFYYIAEAAKI